MKYLLLVVFSFMLGFCVSTFILDNCTQQDHHTKQSLKTPFEPVNTIVITEYIAPAQKIITKNKMEKNTLDRDANNPLKKTVINKDRLKKYVEELGLGSQSDIIKEADIGQYLVEHYFDDSQRIEDRLNSLNYAAITAPNLINEATTFHLLDEISVFDADTKGDSIIKALSIVTGKVGPQNIYQVEKFLLLDDPNIREAAIETIFRADDRFEFRDTLFEMWQTDKSSDIRNKLYLILSEHYEMDVENFY